MVHQKDVLFVNEEMENTRAVAQDYIQYRLQNSGHVWENGRQGNITPNSVESAMRNLGDEFEERFRNRFDDMINQLHVTEDNAHDTFSAIVNETFADGVNWGRIVALFGFAGRFAVRCHENNLSQLIDSIVDWVTNYMENNLSAWMLSNNSWDGFLEFHARGPESRKSNTWPSFSTVCGYAAAGLGVLTLGALFAQKS